jgi:hypothetical protein
LSFRNCHHLKMMMNQETSEKTVRIASTIFVSGLAESTSSREDWGVAPPPWITSPPF